MYLGLLQSIRYVFYPLLRVILIFFPRATGELNQILRLSWTLLSVALPAHPRANSHIQLPKSDWHGNPGFPRWKWVGKAWRRKDGCRHFLFSRHGNAANTRSECPATLRFLSLQKLHSGNWSPWASFPVKIYYSTFFFSLGLFFLWSDEVCAAHF